MNGEYLISNPHPNGKTKLNINMYDIQKLLNQKANGTVTTASLVKWSIWMSILQKFLQNMERYFGQ